MPKTVPAQQKYNTPQALAYREKLKCEAEGREWKKPKSMKSSSSSSSSSSKSSSGGGGGGGGYSGGGGGSIVDKAKKAGTHVHSFTTFTRLYTRMLLYRLPPESNTCFTSDTRQPVDLMRR